MRLALGMPQLSKVNFRRFVLSPPMRRLLLPLTLARQPKTSRWKCAYLNLAAADPEIRANFCATG